MKMNWYSVLKKSTIGLLLFYIGLVFSQVTTPECVCEDPVNIWYKVSTFQEDKGKIIKLDMTKGQAFSDHQYIYLVVQALETGEIIKLDMRTGQAFSDHQYIYIVVKTIDTGEVTYIAFPNGGDWVATPPKDPFLDALDEEFKNLEDYLKKNKGVEIKKK